jgi:hypothetical protein
MSDPKRLLDSSGDATPLERELLAGELGAAPSAKLEDAVWQRVLGALPPIGPGSGDGGGSGAGGDWGAGAGAAGAGASTAGASAGAGGALAGAAKALVVGLFAGTVAVTGVAEIGERVGSAPLAPSAAGVESTALPATVAPVPQVRSAPAIAAPAPEAPIAAPRGFARSEPSSAVTAATESASARFELPPTADLASRTRGERLALERARRALRGGDPLTALGIADGAAQPGSVLTQEREVLAIEALSAAGRSDAARERARAFLARFPGSPHQKHVAQFVR